MPEGPRSPAPPSLTRPPAFSCMSSQSPGAVRVSVRGELDMATAPRLEEVLERASTQGELVVVDLRRLDLIDSAGAHSLVSCDGLIRSRGGTMLVVLGAGPVARSFDLMELEQVLQVVERLPTTTDRDAVYGHAQATNAIRRQHPDPVHARLTIAAWLLESMTDQRDELRDRVSRLEAELLHLVSQPPSDLGSSIPPPML